MCAWTRPSSTTPPIDAQKALSAVYRMGERFGVGQVIDVLVGANTEKVAKWGHEELSVFGVGADRSRDEWTSIIRQLIHHGYLYQDIAEFSALKFRNGARGVLRGETELRFARPRARVKAEKKRKVPRSVALSGSDVDEELFERLRELRREIAAEQEVPAYVVFSDKTLADMAARRPQPVPSSSTSSAWARRSWSGTATCSSRRSRGSEAVGPPRAVH